MAVTLTSSSVPLPVTPTVSIDISDSADAPLVSNEFAAGMASGFTTKLNQDNKRQDLLAVYGGGGYGVCSGFVITAGSGLQAAVAAGKAVCGGVLEKTSSSNVVVSASSTNWIWLKQDGTFVVQTTTAKPSGECVLLGAAVTDGSGVTSIETAGVVYLRGGQLWRQTADSLAPQDSPGSTLRIWTTTAGGEYFWNGSAWLLLAPAGSPVLKEVTLAYGDFSAAGLTNTINALLLPAKSVVMAVKGRVGTAFAGSGISALAFNVGITGTDDKYISALDGTSAGNDSDLTGSVEADSSTTQTVVKATATGANLDQLTQGSLVVSILYAVTG